MTNKGNKILTTNKLTNHSLATLTYLTHNQYNLNQNKITMIINETSLSVLIDTGASISVIKETICDTLNDKHNIRKLPSDIDNCTLADGTITRIMFMVYLNVTLGTSKESIKFYALKYAHEDVIMGCDMLKKFNATIDYGENLVSFKPIRNKLYDPIKTATLGYIDTSNMGQDKIEGNSELNKIDFTESDLDSTQKAQMMSLLEKYEDRFASDLCKIGCTDLVELDIPLLPGSKPVRKRPYRTNFKDREIIHKELRKLLEAGIIQECPPPTWSLPIVLVNKKESQEKRMCIDMKDVNKCMLLPQTHTPNIDDLLSDLGHRRCRYYTTIDLSKAFHQIKLTENAKKIATFVTPFGCYSFNRAPYGVKNISIVFTSLMNKVLQGALNSYCFAWIDDICIYSETFEQHLIHVEDILKRLRDANLTIEARKAHIAKKSVRFIGFILDKTGIKPDPANIEKVVKFKRPTDVKSTRAYIGLTGFLRRFVKDYAQIARPLQLLTHKDTKFKWNEQAEKAFTTLQYKITHAPTLGYVDLMSNEPLILATDASQIALGHCLRQNQMTETGKMEERYLLFGGRSLTDQQKLWPIWELELLSIVTAFCKLDQYLRCKPFTLICDSACVTHLLSKDIITLKPRLARWVMSLRNYNYNVIHRPGNSENLAMADYLSRIQDTDGSEEINVKVEPYLHNITVDRQDKNDNQDKNTNDTMKLSTEDIKLAQREHSFYKPMIDYITKGDLPTTKKLTKRIESSAQDYIVMEELLYHLWYDKMKERVTEQLCITEDHREHILKACHDCVFSGHNGQINTLIRVRERYYWKGMTRDCAQYVESCEVCARANRSYTAPVPLQNIPVPDHPMACFSIDLLSISSSSNRYKHIFVAVCNFSKFVIAKPMVNKKGISTATMILNHIILPYGIPHHLNIISDSGPDMVSTIVQTLYDSFNIKNVRITSYHAMGNGAVERQNSNLLCVLRRYCMDDPKSWSKYLQYAVLSINSSRSASSGYSAFELLHGYQMKTPLDIQLPKPRKHNNMDQERAYKYWYDNLSKMRNIARDVLKYSKKIQKRSYDKKCKPHSLEIGDTVYVSRPAILPGNDPKLSSKFPKKCKIVKFIGTTNALLEDMNGNRMDRSMHINRLKKVPDKRFPEKRQVCHKEDKLELDKEEADQNQLELQKEKRAIPIVPPQHRERKDEHEHQLHNGNIHEMPEPQQPYIIRREQEPNNTNPQELDNKSDVSEQGYQSDDSDATIIMDEQNETDRENTPDIQEESNDVYHPIEKILKKRSDDNGNVEYLCKWENYPNRHNSWVEEGDLANETREQIEKLDIPSVKPRPTVLTIKAKKTKKKIIADSTDWLAYRHVFDKPINHCLLVKGNIYNYESHTIEDVYYCLLFQILGLEEALLICDKQPSAYNAYLSDYFNLHNIMVFNNLILFLTLCIVFKCKQSIEDKLMGTYGQLINSKEINTPENYVNLLMLYREVVRRMQRINVSIDQGVIRSIMSKIHGISLGDPGDFLDSPIDCVNQNCFVMMNINLKREWIEKYRELCDRINVIN